MTPRLLPIVILSATLLGSCTERTPLQQRLDERSASVGIMALQWSREVARNTDFTVKLMVRNAGGETIPSQASRANPSLQVQASYHWKTTDHRVIVWDGVLTPLASDLLPGDEQRLELAVRAPDQPGKYVLEVDLLQTTAYWFGGSGSQTATMIIDVR